MDALVSIITPCYNCENFISKTIESVISQSYQNWEMLIIDDCSTDASFAVAESYAKNDKRIKVYKNKENQGAYFSRNFAINEAKGTYVAFLDSDDIWLPEKLQIQIDFMQKNECDFSFSEYEWIDSDGEPLKIKARVVKHLSYKKNLFHNWPGCLTVMYNQERLGKIQGKKKGNGDDYALFLDGLKKAKKAMGIKRVLAKYRRHSESISYSRLKMVKNHLEVLHDIEGLPFIVSLFCLFTHTAIIYLYKNKKIKK